MYLDILTVAQNKYILMLTIKHINSKNNDSRTGKFLDVLNVALYNIFFMLTSKHVISIENDE